MRPSLLLPLIALAACATQPREVPVVRDPGAQPMSRVNVQGFAACTEGKPLPYRAEVVTELEVGPEGFVTDAKIVRSDDPCLNRPVLIAVRQWRYPPRLVEGELARREGVRALLIFAQDAEPRGVSPGRSTR